MHTYEFKVELPDGRTVDCEWVGDTWEKAAKRLLACKYPDGKVVAWRYPTHTVSTVLPRGV